MSETSSTPTSGSDEAPGGGSGDGALADDPSNDADGRGVESTTVEDGTTFEPEEDPEGAAE